MIKIFSIQQPMIKNRKVELGLYHGGLLYIAENGGWGYDDYVQLDVQSARDLAAALNKWADKEETLIEKINVQEKDTQLD